MIMMVMMKSVWLNFAYSISCLRLVPAAAQLQQTLNPLDLQDQPGRAVEVGSLNVAGAALKVKHASKDVQFISTKRKTPAYGSLGPYGWPLNFSQAQDQQAPYHHQLPAKSESPAKTTTKAKKILGWGNFYFNVKTAKFSLLVTGKIVDHINGTFSVYFRHNSSRLGNISVSIVPPSKSVVWEVLHTESPGPQAKNPGLEASPVHPDPSQSTSSVQKQWNAVILSELNCRIEYQRTNRSKKTKPCLYNPDQTCYLENTQSHAAWICAKPFKVICIFIVFTGSDYKLVQKICPDHNFPSEQNQQHFGR